MARRGEAGMVLVAAMMIMALLAILAVAGYTASTLEVRIAANDRDAKQAFYLCEAGLEKAKYEIIKGWGVGTGGSGTFAFNAATMPDVVKTADWWGSGTNKWAGFQLLDAGGASFPVTGNDATFGLTVTGTPDSGRGTLYYANAGAMYEGHLAPSGPNVLRSATPAFQGKNYRGYFLFDLSTNTVVDSVASNTDYELTLQSSSHADGDYRIYALSTAAGSCNLASGLPNGNWTIADFNGTNANRWYLVDSSSPPQVFRVTGATLSGTFSRLQLALFPTTGTPALGAFRLVTNPWLVFATSSTYTATDFPAPSGTTYGTVQTTISTVAATPGSFTLTATATTDASGGATSRSISMDARLDPTNGSPRLLNWRQGP